MNAKNEKNIAKIAGNIGIGALEVIAGAGAAYAAWKYGTDFTHYLIREGGLQSGVFLSGVYWLTTEGIAASLIIDGASRPFNYGKSKTKETDANNYNNVSNDV